MFSLSRRQGHAALAGVAAAATYLAAAEAGSRRPVRVGGLFMLSSMAMAGLTTGIISSRAHAKASAVEARFTNLIANGGSFGGDIHVNGNHYVTGAAHVTGAGIFGGALSAVGTSGNTNQGAPSETDGDSDQSAAGSSYSQAYENATTNRLNNLKADHNNLCNGSVTALVNRMNNFINALG